MTKEEATTIINNDLNNDELNPRNGGNVRFSNKTSSGKNVFWINICIDDRLLNNYHLILNDNIKQEFTHLMIPANALDIQLFKVRKNSGKDHIDLELSYDEHNYLQDVKSGGTNFNFNPYVEKIYKI